MSSLTEVQIESKKKRQKKNDKMKSNLELTSQGIKMSTFKNQSIHKIRKNKAYALRLENRQTLNPKILEKYSKGDGVNLKSIKNHRASRKMKKREEQIKNAEEETARAEVLLAESKGYMCTEEGKYTTHVTQREIREAVDITSATHSFDLSLTEFGPYRFRYTRNGRHLVLGGRKGHLASFDWLTKKLHFEINVMESIHDVCFLHTEQMMAVAQKESVYIYDNQGIEIHCLKKLNRVLNLEFLPYHFLLCSGNESGFLSWLDVTLGKEIKQVYTKKGRIYVMKQNPYNAVLYCGHPNGTVTMWTPNDQSEVASMLCHPSPIRSIDIDPSGRYLATAGADRSLKIWDVRNLGNCLRSCRVNSGVNNVSFSQSGLVAISMGNIVEVWRDIQKDEIKDPYMRHQANGTVTGLQFCPYEDVLGVSMSSGFSSLIIPGSGEPNFDALEANPYISTSGRREAEVKSLLSKVPMELISMDPGSISQVDVPTLQEKLNAKSQIMHIKVPKIDVTPRYRMKGKSGSAQKFRRKEKLTNDVQREYLKEALEVREQLINSGEKKKNKSVPKGILDRFKPKISSVK